MVKITKKTPKKVLQSMSTKIQDTSIKNNKVNNNIDDNEINNYIEFDFTNLIQTVPIRPTKFSANAVYVAAIKSFSKTQTSPKIIIRITDDVREKLNWKVKDTIGVFHDKDDLKKLFLFKAQNGFTLSQSEKLYRFEFTWKQSPPIETFSTEPKMHEIIATKEAKILTLRL
jgi:hypothetical protein